MNLLSIPSELCPECRLKTGHCSMVVSEVETFREQMDKAKEEDIRAEMFGKKSPRYREVYVVQKYVCLKGKGFP